MSADTKKSNGPMPTGIKNGWFTEVEALWPGQKFSLALEEFSNDSVLFHDQSEYQEIMVFESAQYGKVLVLDGVIQLTERDEFSYHESMVHLPLCAHANPQRILIVGGGDGGAIREVLKHDTIREVVVVEIDPMVVQVSKQFFSNSTAIRLVEDDPRVTIVHTDAAHFLGDDDDDNETNGGMKKNRNYWDVIICDTIDPVGPAESLFEPKFYEAMHRSLRRGGIVCVQAECFWIHLALISDLLACCSDIFDHAEYCTTMVPTYPCGQIGFILATKKRGSCRQPIRQVPANEASQLKWYTPAIHQAAFTLPRFVTKELEGILPPEQEREEDDGDCLLNRAPCVIL